MRSPGPMPPKPTYDIDNPPEGERSTCVHCGREIEYDREREQWVDADALDLVFCWSQDGDDDLAIPAGSDLAQRHQPEPIELLLPPAVLLAEHQGANHDDARDLLAEIDHIRPRP